MNPNQTDLHTQSIPIVNPNQTDLQTQSIPIVNPNQTDLKEVKNEEILPDPQQLPHSTESQLPIPPPESDTQTHKPAPFNPQDMANLAGMDFEDPISSTITTTNRQENIDEAKTQLPIYKRSLFKLILIGGSFLIGTLAVGKMIFPSPQPEIATVPKQATTVADKTKGEFAPDPRFGVVNSKLAIEGQEKRILDAANAQQAAAAQDKASQSSNPTTTPGTAAAATVDSNPEIIKNNNPPTDLANQSAPPMNPGAPVASTSPSPPVTPAPKAIVAAPTPAPKAIVAAPTPAPKAIVAAPIAAPKAIVAPRLQPTLKKPLQIARANQIQAPVPRQSNAAPITKTPVTWEIANRNAVGLWNRAVVTAPSSTGYKSPAKTAPAIVGQQIRSKLVVPYQSPTTAPTQLIFVGLSAPVLDIRGRVLLPTGTQIMCEVAAMDNGMLQVNSAKASIDGQLIDLPKNSIMLQDDGKQPLVAQLKTFNQGEVFNRDLYAIAGNVASAIGQNLTQSQTQTIATNGGVVQSTNPSINIPGAALSGFAPVVSQWMQRNQSAITQINATSKIWFLPTGTEINLVIAQSFTL